jgi:hypothetical protein
LLATAGADDHICDVDKNVCNKQVYVGASGSVAAVGHHHDQSCGLFLIQYHIQFSILCDDAK